MLQQNSLCKRISAILCIFLSACNVGITSKNPQNAQMKSSQTISAPSIYKIQTEYIFNGTDQPITIKPNKNSSYNIEHLTTSITIAPYSGGTINFNSQPKIAIGDSVCGSKGGGGWCDMTINSIDVFIENPNEKYPHMLTFKIGSEYSNIYGARAYHDKFQQVWGSTPITFDNIESPVYVFGYDSLPISNPYEHPHAELLSGLNPTMVFDSANGYQHPKDAPLQSIILIVKNKSDVAKYTNATKSYFSMLDTKPWTEVRSIAQNDQDLRAYGVGAEVAWLLNVLFDYQEQALVSYTKSIQKNTNFWNWTKFFASMFMMSPVGAVNGNPIGGHPRMMNAFSLLSSIEKINVNTKLWPGSFQETCSDILYDTSAHTLSANCKTISGATKKSTLSPFNCWVNDSKEIENNNGNLACSKNRYPQIPTGKYLNDCKDIKYTDGILTARCGRDLYANATPLNYAVECSDTSEVHLTGGGRGIYNLTCTTLR